MDVTATPSRSARLRMVSAFTPSFSISSAAVFRISSAVTPGSPAGLRRGGAIGFIPGHPILFRHIEITLQITVHVDDAPLYVGQDQVRHPRLVQSALKTGEHRDVLLQH